MNTPETDSKKTDIVGFFSCSTVPSTVAGKLERERDEAREQRDAITLRLGQTQEHLIDARRAAEHYRNLYYLPKDGLEAAKNHPLPWECQSDSSHNA